VHRVVVVVGGGCSVVVVVVVSLVVVVAVVCSGSDDDADFDDDDDALVVVVVVVVPLASSSSSEGEDAFVVPVAGAPSDREAGGIGSTAPSSDGSCSGRSEASDNAPNAKSVQVIAPTTAPTANRP
jgi:hypothetical protein